MGRSNSEDSVLANGLNLNGLLPHEDGTVTRKLDPERWAKAESRTEELIARIQPNQSSEDHRQAVASHMERLIKECIHCQVSTFGSVPLKTYLPDGDIDLTALSMNPSLSDNWANEVRDMLKREEKNECSEFQVREVQYVQAEVKLVKCLVDNIVVDISFNQLGGLCTLCFLEEVDHLIGRNHLFKRSIILIKAWCYYESRILGAYHGLISTYALEILVLYIFHIFNNSFAGPLEVLYRFLAFFSKFDWDNFCISLWGPVPVGSFDNAAADFPRSDGGEVLLSQSFLQACSSFYSVYPRNHETLEQPFIFKFFNVVDPLRTNNNLGRSVSKGNFYRIRSAFSFGAQKLGRLMDCSEEDVIAGLNHFFSNTWERHGKGNRPDTRTLDSPLVLPGTVKINKKMNESLLSSEEDVENFRDSHGNRMAMNDTGKVFRIDSFQKKLHSIPLFARTYSSPELRITSTEALSQDRFGVKGENVQDTYASKISQKTCHSGDGEDSDWKSSGVDPSSKLDSSHGYGDGGFASHVKSTCGSTSNVSKREELASVGGAGGIPATRNMVPFPTHSLGGPVQLPVPVFGYVYQNPFGMGPRFPSVVAPYAYPQGYSPTSSSLHSTANARSSESEEGGKHHDDDAHCRWDYEEMMDERILSTSGQGISSGHESIQQPKYGMPDVIAKENCEAAGGIYDDGNRFRTDEEGNMVEHHSSNDGDEIAERMQRLNIEMPNPSVSSHVEEFQMPRYGPTHNFSNWMLPGSIPQNHLGSWQWVTGTNQQMLPIAVHPGTGPPVPFFSMVPPAPPHNLPTEIGNTGVATNLFQREEADISMVPPGLGSDAVDVADKSGDPGKSDSTNVNIASSEHSEEAASDILAGDFASHWQNLEYGRRCQNWQLPFPIFYHPPPPMYYHGNLPNYDDMGVPSPGADKPQFIPFSSNQTRTGGIRHQSGGFPMRRGGTGTYLPNQGNMGVRQPPSPRHYRANFNDENREQHHWDREEKWSQNSKPRFANRQRYQSEKNTRTYRPMGRNGRNERQWYGYRDNNYCPPRHHPSNGVNAPSDPVENQKSESVVGSVASTTRGRGQTYFPPDQPSPIFGSVSDHIA